MRTTRLVPRSMDVLPDTMRHGLPRRARKIIGWALVALAALLALAFMSWSVLDRSLNNTGGSEIRNLLGFAGAVIADLGMQLFGLGVVGFLAALALLGLALIFRSEPERLRGRLVLVGVATLATTGFFATLPNPAGWPLPTGIGGAIGDAIEHAISLLSAGSTTLVRMISGALFIVSLAGSLYLLARGLEEPSEATKEETHQEYARNGANRPASATPAYGAENDPDEPSRASLAIGVGLHWVYAAKGFLGRLGARLGLSGPEMAVMPASGMRREPGFGVAEPMVNPPAGAYYSAMGPAETAGSGAYANHEAYAQENAYAQEDDPDDLPFDMPDQTGSFARVTLPVGALKPGKRAKSEAQPSIFGAGFGADGYEFPPLALLAEPKKQATPQISAEALEQNARLLEGVLDDFGVRGEIINVRPGPVVTLYELEPAPGTKSSRVIGLAEDIARSMSAVAARVAVVSGRNAIGIELPNAKRETVLLRELLACEDFEKSKLRLPICLGKTIGGEPVIVDLARMPHLLVAGTTGSGKSVAINTMICSLLYHLKPEQCRLIMIDPKMLELSVYDGIPHLLSPVVTDPKKAVVALKWAVREMEDRYRKMSKVGVRNIDGYNARMDEAAARGEQLTRTIQSGYDRQTGEALYEEEVMDTKKIPYIVVIVDEMADLMLVAGKEIEGAVQRLAQMARAAGIHIVMATQRPSVDVITGTIKANFPTRISFQVTSKIDSRTILGEMGAEQLLGQGDMLYMAGGGRISRVHGPFVADGEVEKVVNHLKTQGVPDYVDAVTLDEETAAEGSDGEDGAVFDKGEFGDESADLYDQAVAVVLRDKKVSTSYVQRRLQIGYNRAASIIERMEREGIVGPPNHAGKREILLEATQ